MDEELTKSEYNALGEKDKTALKLSAIRSHNIKYYMTLVSYDTEVANG